MALKHYTVDVGNRRGTTNTTLKLNDADAKRLGAKPVGEKAAKAPANKARGAATKAAKGTAAKPAPAPTTEPADAGTETE